MVGVATTHRRQGILTRLMARQLDDVVERGEALAILTASETSIYGRFGYGWAASSVVVEVEALRSGFRTPPAAPGRLQVVTGSEARGLIPAAYERGRVTRAGTASPDPMPVWDLILADRQSRRGGDSGLFVVVHLDAAGEPDGFASYRIKFSWLDSLPDNTVVVTDLYGADFEVEATLWRFLLDVDLATRVRVMKCAVDDPIRWRLVEPRRLRTREVADYLWARLLDVPRALSLRTYGADDGLTLEVVDPFRPASGGRFRVEGSPDGAQCAVTTAEPDLVIGPRGARLALPRSGRAVDAGRRRAHRVPHRAGAGPGRCVLRGQPGAVQRHHVLTRHCRRFWTSSGLVGVSRRGCGPGGGRRERRRSRSS